MDFGLDRLTQSAELLKRLRGARVGVLAHAASVDRAGCSMLHRLEEAGVKVVTLFAPEHGFVGAAQDMIVIDDDHDQRRGVPVVSLYGDELKDLIPRAEHLSGIDVLLVDLMDVGSRYYTYVWTALLATRAASKCGVHVILLDRANPISGLSTSVEGSTQREGFTSFVGWEPVPIRHALTIGEMVALHIAEDGHALGPDGAFSALTVQGWERASLAESWERLFVFPSPNMPSPDTALVYPGGCLLEGTNLSEGRGHTRPFEVVGAPWLDGERWATELMALDLGGVFARPLCFQPTFHKHAAELCGGVQIHVTDAVRFRPVATYVALVALAYRQNPDRFRFRTERYEFVDDIPAFDLLTGSSEARCAIVDGAEPRAVAELVSASDPDWPERMLHAQSMLERAAW